MPLTLVPVDSSNWRTPLSVREDQATFVASATMTLARAYAFNAEHSRCIHICLDGTAIGMALWYDWAEGNAYVLSEFFIDQRWQRQGYGLAAMGIILAEMRREGRFPRVVLCYVAGNEAAPAFYARLGFTPETGDDFDEDEPGMGLDL